MGHLPPAPPTHCGPHCTLLCSALWPRRLSPGTASPCSPSPRPPVRKTAKSGLGHALSSSSWTRPTTTILYGSSSTLDLSGLPFVSSSMCAFNARSSHRSERWLPPQPSPACTCFETPSFPSLCAPPNELHCVPPPMSYVSCSPLTELTLQNEARSFSSREEKSTCL